jgi:hypothetical protein
MVGWIVGCFVGFVDAEGCKLSIALGIIVIEGGTLLATEGFRVIVGVLLE